MAKIKPPASSKKTAEIIPLGFVKRPKRSPSDKWTKAAINLGFCTVPSILLWGQARLGLTSEQFNIIMQLADMWWDAGDPPFPTKELLADRTGIWQRQIQRHLTALEAKGLIKRVPRYRGKKTQVSNAYEMNGLIKKITALVPDFKAMQDQKRIRRRKVEAKAKEAS